MEEILVMCNTLTIQPIQYIDGIVNLPGSKSISNRVLLLAAQAVGTTRLINLLDSDDTNYMLIALKKLGINYRLSKNKRICEVDGIGKPLYTNHHIKLFLGNAGTAMRPLTAALCLQPNDIILTGEARMKERPIGSLVHALRQGGAQIDYIENENYPPLHIRGGYKGGNIIIDGSISSQFITALLMMAPLASHNSCIHIVNSLVSQPYIDITLKLMRIFKINIQHINYRQFYILGNSTYCSPGEYIIEGDASSASYFLAAAAIRGGTVQVRGVGKKSIQGDIRFADILKKMGAIIRWNDYYIECSRSTLQSIDMDMNHIPDVAMTIAITALFVQNGTTTLRNIANWRIKETDRLTAMSTELRKIGASVSEGTDYLSITPPNQFKTACINTYNDHRIAMCFSLIALSGVPIIISNPKCTHKTFRNFFSQLFNLSKNMNLINKT